MKTIQSKALACVAAVLGTVVSVHAQGRPISLPPQASEVAQGIYDLGFAQDSGGKVVQGFAFVHYKREFARPPGGGKPTKSSTCYAFMASGAKWKSVEPYVFDEAEHNAKARLGQMEAGILTWHNALPGRTVLGPGYLGDVYPGALYTLNDLNEVMFGTINEPGVIAVTIVWGIFGGPPQGRELVEWDMVFGNAWDWWFDEITNPTGEVMDFLNIATHELGHAFGLDHPGATCTEETMYAYADYAETKKRDLNAGDIAGIRKLYP